MGRIPGKIRRFYRSHIWFRISVILLFALAVGTITGRWYLKEAFVQYIESNTYNVEEQTLSASNAVLESSFKELITLGSTMAVDQELADVVNEYRVSGSSDAYVISCMYELLGEYTRRSQWVQVAAIFDEQGIIYQFDRNQNGSAKPELLWNETNIQYACEMLEKILAKVAAKETPQYAVSAFPQTLRNTNMFHLAFPLKGKLSKTDGTNAIVVLSVKTEIFEEFIEELNRNSNNLANGYLVDSEGRIFLHKDTEYIGTLQSEYLGEEDVNIQESISKTGLTANIVIDNNILQEQVSKIYNQGMFLYNIFFAVALIGILFTMRWALKPVDAIKKSIEKVKEGNFQELIEVKGEHEIWKLAEEYNRMIVAVRTMQEETKRQYQENVTAIRMKQEAEWEALESQINAHFICNTLNAINYEVMDAGNYKAATWIKKLSNILRYTFGQKKQEVYMCQEVAWIEQYLFLQKSRLEKTFDYEVDFSEELMEWPCRKLMLQPFVENSILHGFEGWQEGGYLRITGRQEGEFLKIVIEDNGNGMSEERKNVLQQVMQNPPEAKKLNVGIGISNVIMRMKMYYGEQFGVTMESEEGQGTRFTFLIPRVPEKRE